MQQSKSGDFTGKTVNKRKSENLRYRQVLIESTEIKIEDGSPTADDRTVP